ncbi:hypothetical protein CVT24_002609 [Panaeolus cyanescens]|uniref:Retrotransposon gag domain-containing protein n=1 Tax=Panaeolus cyanescens TaxID=181874 RepID=A0A409YTW2_9AGAR|nr:hypothetical protein CVT24_002609 [Panaeolus cyanescens]
MPNEHWRDQPRENGKFVRKPAAQRDRSATLVPHSQDPYQHEDPYLDLENLEQEPASTSAKLLIHSASTLDSGITTPVSEHCPLEPPAPPPPPVPKPTPLNMSLGMQIPEFAGNTKDTCQPSAFLKNFAKVQRACSVAETQYCDIFGDYLVSNSPAAKWFASQSTPKSSWPALKKAFMDRFPDIPEAEETKPDIQRRLLELRLDVARLGEKEKVAGTEVWSHVAFAGQIRNLAAEAGIDNEPSMIFMVRDELPTRIRDKIPANHSSWSSFAKAIAELDLDVVKDTARRHKETEAKEAKLKAELTASATIPVNLVANASDEDVMLWLSGGQPSVDQGKE